MIWEKMKTLERINFLENKLQYHVVITTWKCSEQQQELMGSVEMRMYVTWISISPGEKLSPRSWL